MGRYDYARSHSGISRGSRDAADRKRKFPESSGGSSSKAHKTEKTRVEAKPDMRTEVKPKSDAKVKLSTSTSKTTANDCKQLRAEVRSVFLAYKALQHACKAGQSTEEGVDSSEAEALMVGPNEEKHFHTLLASLKAKPCVRRLAARVLPSLAVRYPQLLDSVIHACLSTSDSIPKDVTEKHSKATKKEVCAEIISRQDAPSALAATKYAFRSLRGKLKGKESKGSDSCAELVALFRSVPKQTLTALLSCTSSADKLAVEVAEAFLEQLVQQEASLVRDVLHPDAHLERWLVQQVHDARQQAVPGTPQHDALRRTQPAVDKVISALKTCTPEDLNIILPSPPDPVDAPEPEPEPEPVHIETEQAPPTSTVAEEELPSSTPPPPPSPQLPPPMEQQPMEYVQSTPPPPPTGMPVVDPQWQQPPLPPMPHPHSLMQMQQQTPPMGSVPEQLPPPPPILNPAAVGLPLGLASGPMQVPPHENTQPPLPPGLPMMPSPREDNFIQGPGVSPLMPMSAGPTTSGNLMGLMNQNIISPQPQMMGAAGAAQQRPGMMNISQPTTLVQHMAAHASAGEALLEAVSAYQVACEVCVGASVNPSVDVMGALQDIFSSFGQVTNIVRRTPLGAPPGGLLCIEFLRVEEAVHTWETLRTGAHHQDLPIVWESMHFGAGSGKVLYVAGLSQKELLQELACSGMDLPDRRLELSRSGQGLLLDYTSKPTPKVQAVLMHLRGLRSLATPAQQQQWLPPGGAMGNFPAHGPFNDMPMGPRNLWVGRLGPEIQERDIYETFSRFGNLRNFKLLLDRHCAFINYANPDSAAAALAALDGTRLRNSIMTIEFKDGHMSKGVGPAGMSRPMGGLGEQLTLQQLMQQQQAAMNMKDAAMGRVLPGHGSGAAQGMMGSNLQREYAAGNSGGMMSLGMNASFMHAPHQGMMGGGPLDSGFLGSGMEKQDMAAGGMFNWMTSGHQMPPSPLNPMGMQHKGMHTSGTGAENTFPLMEGGIPGPPGLGGIQNMAMRMQGTGGMSMQVQPGLAPQNGLPIGQPGPANLPPPPLILQQPPLPTPQSQMSLNMPPMIGADLPGNAAQEQFVNLPPPPPPPQVPGHMQSLQLEQQAHQQDGEHQHTLYGHQQPHQHDEHIHQQIPQFNQRHQQQHQQAHEPQQNQLQQHQQNQQHQHPHSAQQQHPHSAQQLHPHAQQQQQHLSLQQHSQHQQSHQDQEHDHPQQNHDHLQQPHQQQPQQHTQQIQLDQQQHATQPDQPQVKQVAHIQPHQKHQEEHQHQHQHEPSATKLVETSQNDNDTPLEPPLPPPPVQEIAKDVTPPVNDMTAPQLPSWVGTLAKSGSPLCQIVCTQHGTGNAGTSSCEPYDWPTTLDVLMRAELTHVLSHVFKSAQPQHRVIRWLHPKAGSAADHTKPFVKFIDYLGQRLRAGVVKMSKAISEQGRSARTLYLIPPSTSVCAAMGVERDPQSQRECLLALVVYTPEK